MGCNNGPFYNGIYFFYCDYAQNYQGLVVAFDPGDGNPLHAGTVGGPRIIAIMNTWGGGANTPNRQNVIHSIEDQGANGFGVGIPSIGYQGNSLTVGGSTRGNVPAIVTTHTAINSSNYISCVPYGYSSSKCLNIQVDANSGLYEPYYWVSAGSNSNLPLSPTQVPGIPITAKVGDAFCMSEAVSTCNVNPNYANDTVRLVSKGTTGNWVILDDGAWNEPRGSFNYNDANAKYMIIWNNAQQTGYPLCDTLNGGWVFWNPTTDPLGQNTIGDTQFCGSHAMARVNSIVEYAGAGAYRVRTNTANNITTTLTTPYKTVNLNNTFHTVSGPVVANPWQSHPGVAGSQSSTYESQTGFDIRPLIGYYTSTPANADLYTNVTGNLYVATPSVVTNADNVTFSQTALNRQIYATSATSGIHPLRDVSGLNCVIDGTSTYAYTYAFVRNDGECYSGSTRGQVYVNAPAIIYPFCEGNSGSGITSPEQNDICVTNMGVSGNGLTQFNMKNTDTSGLTGRLLSKMMISAPKAFTGTNGPNMFPSKYIMWGGNYTDSLTLLSYFVQLPQYPLFDSVTRNYLVPITVSLKPSMTVDNAIVEFGYYQYGSSLTNCTSRNDTCIANSATMPLTNQPFAFASDSPSGVSCGSGCTIQIPGESRHVVYYRVKYRDVGNNVVYTSPFTARMVP